MNDERRVALESIAFGSDPRITPENRMKALEMLGSEATPDDTALWLGRQVAALSDEALARELGQYDDSGWHPPDPGADAQAADQYGAAVVNAIAVEESTTVFPATTRRIAALAEAMLPALDARRVQAGVDRQVAERIEALRAGDEAKGNAVPLRPAQPSDHDSTQPCGRREVERAEAAAHGRRPPPRTRPASSARSPPARRQARCNSSSARRAAACRRRPCASDRRTPGFRPSRRAARARVLIAWLTNLRGPRLRQVQAIARDGPAELALLGLGKTLAVRDGRARLAFGCAGIRDCGE